MDLCSHAGLLTKVLQEVIGNDNKGKERKWWMVEPSGEPTLGDWIELIGQEKHYIAIVISNVGLHAPLMVGSPETNYQMSQNGSKPLHLDSLPILN